MAKEEVEEGGIKRQETRMGTPFRIAWLEGSNKADALGRRIHRMEKDLEIFFC